MLLLWKFKTLDTSVLKQKSIYVSADKIFAKTVKASFCGNVLSPPSPSEFFSKTRKQLRMEKRSEKESDKPVILHFRQVKKITKTKFIGHFYWRGCSTSFWKMETLWTSSDAMVVHFCEISWWNYLVRLFASQGLIQAENTVSRKSSTGAKQKIWQQNKTWIIFYGITPCPPT